MPIYNKYLIPYVWISAFLLSKEDKYFMSDMVKDYFENIHRIQTNVFIQREKNTCMKKNIYKTH